MTTIGVDARAEAGQVELPEALHDLVGRLVHRRRRPRSCRRP